uniref:Uncharacterized protein n=1 Tax=Chromera velia CCMP2878 TaxID=1169474 RepID=A0A0G4I742_9ALVE|eukprot:Cvel_11591.t1-p1 / transcript=Cvel_11591.t1 / gene=Cvel_11591 / organism=Chromera_velia_CCMP2878 / gene_product=hypothetical protein / transcript_product=hypothetical protein / location=Cvel_scaffold733:44448-45370(+) / protein_length=246 / sequence_SO=supercontig / SO=protein_coding / is_pseudo=false
MGGTLSRYDTMGGLAGGLWAEKGTTAGEGRETNFLDHDTYFLDQDAENDFIYNHQGKRRVGLLLAASVCFAFDILDFGAMEVIGGNQTDPQSEAGGLEGMNLLRKIGTMTANAFLLCIALWYPFAPVHFEKLVAGGILLYVFSMSILREGVTTKFASPEDIILVEAILVALNTMFVVMILIVLPLRRPTMCTVIGGACVIQVATVVSLVVMNRPDMRTAVTASFGIWVTGTVLVTVGFGLAREEVG